MKTLKVNQLPITNYQLPVTNYQLPVTSYQLPVTKIFPHICNPSKIILSLFLKATLLSTQEAYIDRERINLCIQGDRKAQYELYRDYSSAMFNICIRMMNSRTEAEDMLQEAFMEAFSKLQSYRFESGFGPWLKRIVVNKCINTLQRKQADLEFLDDLDPFTGIAEPEEETPYMEGITVDKVMKAMDHLPKGSRMIFSLYLLEGYDHQEIAQILKISESNSKSQYMRARQKIKSILTPIRYEN